MHYLHSWQRINADIGYCVPHAFADASILGLQAFEPKASVAVRATQYLGAAMEQNKLSGMQKLVRPSKSEYICSCCAHLAYLHPIIEPVNLLPMRGYIFMLHGVQDLLQNEQERRALAEWAHVLHTRKEAVQAIEAANVSIWLHSLPSSCCMCPL
jgi:hypothetical protein